MNKRLVSIICAAALFTQTLPTNAIATTIEDAFIKKGLNSEVDKDKSDSNSEESSSKDENETSQDNKLKEEELGLDKVKFNAYIDKTDQLFFSDCSLTVNFFSFSSNPIENNVYYKNI